jgi:hypothetical protein
MNPLNLLTNLFSAHRKPKFLRDNIGKITEAFEHRGEKYYMFDDIFQLPTDRALQALDYYEEFNMRCTKSYLKGFCEACEKIITNPKKIDLIQLGQLVRYLQERLEMIPVPDHIYRLASVVFFDKSESPYFYDRKYAQVKIAKWKEDPEMLAFFLRTPLKDLIPSLDSDGRNLSMYSEVVEQLNKMHHKAVLSLLSDKDMNIDM